MEEEFEEFLKVRVPSGHTIGQYIDLNLRDAIRTALAQSTQSPVEQPPARPEPADYKPDAVDKILKAAAKPATEYTVQEYMDKFHSNEQPPQTVAGDSFFDGKDYSAALGKIEYLLNQERQHLSFMTEENQPDYFLDPIKQDIASYEAAIELIKQAALTRHEGA